MQEGNNLKSLESPKIPDVFCWTKMQAEAGQQLALILQRKNLEREAGEGIFFWGIGNSLGSAVGEFAREAGSPEILFSIMKSAPKKHDVRPDSVFLWTRYLDPNGVPVALPPHVLLLSRGHTVTGPKKMHFALVCHSTHSLLIGTHGSLYLDHLRNFGGSKGRLGYSQVTALVRHVPTESQGLSYEVAFKAKLSFPYCVRLVEPKRLSSDIERFIAQKLSEMPTCIQWRDFVRSLRADLG